MKISAFVSMASSMPFPLVAFSKYEYMTDIKKIDVIIVGGSYSGLSAGMTLGRALRNVLIIDSGNPCNRHTPHSHNFITQDGKTPFEISTTAREQVEFYQTIEFHNGFVTNGRKTKSGFEITTKENETFESKNLIFATGVKDIMPDIKGFSECWGISVIHCPYCHGYEVRNQKTGILANGDVAFHYAQLINNWTKDLSIFTNGKATLSEEQRQTIEKHNISIIEKEIDFLDHENGLLNEIVFKDKARFPLKAIYARPDFQQHCKVPEELGCEVTENGLLKIDPFQKTTVEGIYACGDNSSPLRAVSHAVATGNIAAAILNNSMTAEEFK